MNYIKTEAYQIIADEDLPGKNTNSVICDSYKVAEQVLLDFTAENLHKTGETIGASICKITLYKECKDEITITKPEIALFNNCDKEKAPLSPEDYDL